MDPCSWIHTSTSVIRTLSHTFIFLRKWFMAQLCISASDFFGGTLNGVLRSWPYSPVRRKKNSLRPRKPFWFSCLGNKKKLLSYFVALIVTHANVSFKKNYNYAINSGGSMCANSLSHGAYIGKGSSNPACNIYWSFLFSSCHSFAIFNVPINLKNK